MNNQLITKIIKTNDSTSSPELLYENPVIDRNVAGALARSFVKILCVSKQDSNINTNLRHSVLSNIRKLCRIEPDNHLEVDENFTKTLSEVYIDELSDSTTKDPCTCLNKDVDDLIARKMKGVNIQTKYQENMDPEVFQSLLNLNENHRCIEAVSKNVLYWNMSDKKNQDLVKKLWTNINLASSAENINICDISIKMKTEIELLLLNLCYIILTEPNLKVDEMFSVNETLEDLVKKCSLSPECYQICYCILNHVFVHTNYNTDIQTFIVKFVENVKVNCKNSISILYPVYLSFTVILLDINLDTFEGVLKEKYIQRARTQLQLCHEKSESDLVLLLSHFPQWFHVYFT